MIFVRINLAALCLAALCAPGLAQQDSTVFEGPVADVSIVEACLENAMIAREDGVAADLHDCIWLAANACMKQPGGNSTAGMIGCTAQETDYWDMLLNQSYQQRMAEAQDWRPDDIPGGTEDIAPATLLRQMQRDWIAYRDLMCSWRSDPWQGGSIVNVLRAGCMLDATAEQALLLRRGLGMEDQ